MLREGETETLLAEESESGFDERSGFRGAGEVESESESSGK